MKLNRRLAFIDQLITQHYRDIWDCCCDHGQLGAQLLQREIAGTVHFVDQVSTISAQLEQQLQRFFPCNKSHSSPKWLVHCIDAGELPLSAAHPSQTKELIIIAGVGGELCIQLIDSILSKHPQRPLEFILCPVHHQYELREFLAKKKLALLSEHLIEDKRRCYEVLHVSTTAGLNISPIGQQMWQLTNPEHRRYLLRTIQHYQRMSQASAHPALSQYQALLEPDEHQ
ncbi:tRNA (adenine(22)-N(1))-methyltransferase [Agarivorans sp. QJM3NY_25]|uniref:tRNA (adenine(22)-N(1))-methyltransferase n=1 Tax=Agarivorans sp. QJM3NY_25 TaxID=3421430 RepID=UPI003D7EDA83